MDQDNRALGLAARWGRRLILVFLLVGLSIVTAWNLTRSEALGEAQRAYTRGDAEVCLQHALDHLERRPWSREAALLVARCLSRMDYTEEAEPYFRRAGALSLNDMHLRAYGLARGPRHDRAIAAYREILDRSPDDVIAMRRLAAVLLAQNDAPQLLELADRLTRVPGGEVVGAMLRGTVYHNESNPQMAVASFERVLELDPGLREMPASRKLLWDQLAKDLVECGRIEDAGHRLEQALTTERDAELLDLLGYTYFLQANFDEARRCYRQAMEWDPGFYRPHLNLAKLELLFRRHDVALRELNQARLLAPRHQTTLYTLVLMYRQLGQNAEAAQVQQEIQEIKELRQATTLVPGILNPAWPRYAL
jgi:tetratricopeptide (TPR) repeat protein